MRMPHHFFAQHGHGWEFALGKMQTFRSVLGDIASGRKDGPDIQHQWILLSTVLSGKRMACHAGTLRIYKFFPIYFHSY
jgi:hypothetical protein